MRKKLLALVTALTMMVAMAAPAMADPVQVNFGDATAQNYNSTAQINVGVQNNTQVALFGDNYSNQELSQENSNATNQDASAFAGNFHGF